jgi:hypothetical protein
MYTVSVEAWDWLSYYLMSRGQLTAPREGVYMMVVGARSRRFVR